MKGKNTNLVLVILSANYLLAIGQSINKKTTWAWHRGGFFYILNSYLLTSRCFFPFDATANRFGTGYRRFFTH